MSKLTQSPAWHALRKQRQAVDGMHMNDLFADDPDRFGRFSTQACGIFLDYSKNLIDSNTMSLLLALNSQADVDGWRKRLFAGEKINATENRPVLHTALRRDTLKPLIIEGADIMPGIASVLARMGEFASRVQDGSWTGVTGKRITDIVNIGIGGSNLGPRMVTEALGPYADKSLRLHFVSSAGGGMIGGVLAKIPWETTLFIVSTKTFTTAETCLNAQTARDWLIDKSGGKDGLSDGKDIMAHHFVAASSAVARAGEFGIPAQNVFELWDWVGGRYSLWSSVGLVIILAIGMDGFDELLAGARAMDEHFVTAPPEDNLPIILAMLGIWYINFYAARAHAIIPYNYRLSQFPAYLQQVDMESNGKAVDRGGQAVDYDTAPVIWGVPGTDCQHSVLQKLHQGPDFQPADFIIAVETHTPIGEHHRLLLTNFLAQTEALMVGNKEEDVRAALASGGASADEITALLPHKMFTGNRPTNTLLFKRLDPFTLGALIALYEHKVFVQGVVWNVNSFDQWGVELGKQLANEMRRDLDSDGLVQGHDASTNGLINRVKELRRS